jgi:hypothetical protein
MQASSVQVVPGRKANRSLSEKEPRGDGKRS